MVKKLLLALLMLAPVSAMAQKYGHFDYASIMQSMPEYKTAQTELESTYKKYQADLESMQKELQTKAEKYQKEDNDATPANIKERHQQELQDMYTKLQQAQQDNSEDMQKQQSQKMQPIAQKVMNAVNSVATEGGYVYVMDSNSAQSAGIFINPSLSADLTQAVCKKLGITLSATSTSAGSK